MLFDILFNHKSTNMNTVNVNVDPNVLAAGKCIYEYDLLPDISDTDTRFADGVRCTIKDKFSLSDSEYNAALDYAQQLDGMQTAHILDPADFKEPYL